MAWFRAGGGGIPSTLKAEMNDVLNKKFGTFLQNYPPEGWPDNVNLLGPLPIKTASGAIASFSDGADDVPLKSGVFGIVPSGGGGTPSSPVPIVGRSGMTISHGGKNLCNPSDVGNYAISGTDDSISSNANSLANYNKIPVGTNTEISVSCGDYCDVRGIYCYGVNDSFLGRPGTLGETNQMTRTLVSGTTHIRVTFRKHGGGAVSPSDLTSAQIEFGSSSTTYEPYSSATHAVSFGSTVYGGEYSMDGGLKVYPYYPSYNGETLTGKWVSSMDTYAQGTSPTIGAQVVDMSGDNYEETEIDPTPINSRLGANNLWCDTGDAEIEYYADINLALNQ